MEYAKQYHIGHHPKARAKKTGGTAPTVRRIRRSNAENKRRSRSQQGQKMCCSNTPAADGFLRTTFLPKLELEAVSLDSKVEGDFYVSLSVLANHYNLVLTDRKTFGFPYNIALSLSEAEQQLKHMVTGWDCLKLVQDDHQTCFLISEERYHTGATLYYIPVLPLFKMLKDRNRKQAAHLLLSVCAYLYHIADVPYYRSEDSYLYWQYAMISDCLEQDGEEDDSTYSGQLRQAIWVGEQVEQKIFNLKTLDVFEQRLKCFNSRDEFDRVCYKIACDAFEIFTLYPNECIFRNASVIEDEDETICMDKYISFIASTQGSLSHTIQEYVNCEFGEYADIQEPAIVKEFKSGSTPLGDLRFESRVFALIDNLCYLLDCYKKE